MNEVKPRCLSGFDPSLSELALLCLTTIRVVLVGDSGSYGVVGLLLE